MGIGPISVLQGAGFSFSRAIAERLSKLLHREVADSDVRNMATAYRMRDRPTIQRILSKYDLAPKKINVRVLRMLAGAAAVDQLGAAAAFGSASKLAV